MSDAHGNGHGVKQEVVIALTITTALICFVMGLIIGLSDDEVTLPKPKEVSQRIQAVDSKALPIGDSPYLGSESAKVTIVLFSDFGCPYCSKAQVNLEALLNRFPNEVRLVYKFMPLDMHPRAYYAAQAALAADEQGMFWEYHNILYKNQPNFTDEDFIRYAGELGLDTDRFTESYTSGKFAVQVDEDVALAKSIMKSMAAPTLFINGRDFEVKGLPRNLEKIVVQEIARANQVLVDIEKSPNLFYTILADAKLLDRPLIVRKK